MTFDPQHITEFVIRIVLLIGVIILVGAAAIWAVRKYLFKEEEYDEEDDSIYTTARLEELKSQGLIDEAQYAKLKDRSRAAARRRAEAAKERMRKESGRKGLFD
jgi:hypothetical protein